LAIESSAAYLEKMAVEASFVVMSPLCHLGMKLLHPDLLFGLCRMTRCPSGCRHLEWKSLVAAFEIARL
jgi:hypothetical protein